MQTTARHWNTSATQYTESDPPTHKMGAQPHIAPIPTTSASSSSNTESSIEPSPLWKSRLKTRIEQNLDFLIQDAREALRDALSSASSTQAEKKLKAEFERDTRQLRELAEEQFELEVRKEREERVRRGKRKEVSGHYGVGMEVEVEVEIAKVDKSVIREQQAILDAIRMGEGSKRQSAYSSSASGPGSGFAPGSSSGSSSAFASTSKSSYRPPAEDILPPILSPSYTTSYNAQSPPKTYATWNPSSKAPSVPSSPPSRSYSSPSQPPANSHTQAQKYTTWTPPPSSSSPPGETYYDSQPWPQATQSQNTTLPPSSQSSSTASSLSQPFASSSHLSTSSTSSSSSHISSLSSLSSSSSSFSSSSSSSSFSQPSPTQPSSYSSARERHLAQQELYRQRAEAIRRRRAEETLYDEINWAESISFAFSSPSIAPPLAPTKIDPLDPEETLALLLEHEHLWSLLSSSSPSPSSSSSLPELTFTSFPWPLLTPPSTSPSLHLLTLPNVKAYVQTPFLLGMAPSGKEKEKERVKELLRRWHPDRFEVKFLGRVGDDEERVRVREGAGVVVRVLNEILGGL